MNVELSMQNKGNYKMRLSCVYYSLFQKKSSRKPVNFIQFKQCGKNETR